MRFSELARHAIWLVPTDRERIRRERLTSATFEEVIDIVREIESVSRQEREERKAKRPQGFGSYSSAPSRGSSASHFGARGSLQSPYPAHESYYECGEMGHVWRHCPRRLAGPSQQRGQPSASAPVTSPPPAQPARGVGQSPRGRPRAGGRSGGDQAHFYALPSRPNAIASDVFITSIILVCHRDAFVLFDPGSTFSYMSSYFALYLDMSRESLISPVHTAPVPTPTEGATIPSTDIPVPPPIPASDPGVSDGDLMGAI
ncbi:uncharacterized protein [Nicotiana sylvestris]|uniref:uncharacterized protein n=1 Tax=Nicotiana sylvestris TaxID=4096 RepID=UPI00388C4E93